MTLLRIVLADDHEVVRTALRQLLNDKPGIVVVGEAATGEEAVACAHRLKPDILIMDVSMPVMDGVAATEVILRECGSVKVLALTAHSDRAHLARLLSVGAAGYVLKSGAADELVRAIRAVGAGDTYVDPVFAGSMIKRATTGRNGSIALEEELSDREEEVLRQLAWGYSNKEIAQHLGISTKTIETYRSRIAAKLGFGSRPALVRYAIARGWLSQDSSQS